MPAQTATPSKKLQVKINRPAPCQHTLSIRVATAEVRPVREDVVREFQREANIAGFRKGKAPRELVEQKYPSEIREEMLRRVTQQVFQQVQAEHKLKPVGPFEVTKLDFDDAKGLEVEANVEVEPEFKLAAYKGLALKRPSTDVSAEEMDRALAQLQESAAELVPTAEGQEKEKKVPALDDEFAKTMGCETLVELRAHVEEKLRERKTTEQKSAVEQALCDELLKRHTFDVPQRLVARQVERLSRDFQVRLLLSGRTEEQAKEELAKYTEQLKTNAAKLVKLSFILDRVADEEKLTVTDDMVVDRLWKLAQQSRQDPGQVRKALDERGLWPSVLASIRQDQTTAFLISNANISDQ